MKGKMLAVSSVCVLGAAAVLGSVMPAKASGTVPSAIRNAGITAALEKYYERSTNPEAEIMALLMPTVAQAAQAQTEGETEKATEKETEKQTQKSTKQAKKTTKKKAEKETDYYDTIAVSQVNDYVNVRKKPNTDSEIVGKIYNNCAANIIKKKGEWYQIESGNVKGYIKSEYFITGDEAEAKALDIAHVTATVTCETLNVRDGQGTDNNILTQLPMGGVFDVEEYGDKWVYLCVDTDIKGWVSMEYVDINVEFDTAITLEEEAAKIAEEERLAREAEEAAEAARQAELAAEAARQAEAERLAQQQQQAASNKVQEAENTSLAAKRRAVVAYALQFVGYPYVYGGNSLTGGTDCSGFTKLVYANFGYTLNRVSADQQYNGIAVSLDDLKPGDLLLYSSGGYYIGHVALYIGNGQVVHASTPEQGIRVSNAFYRTPVAVRRIIY